MARLSRLSRSIEGKVAVVTGAASGMGRATAALLADEGAAVAIFDRSAEALDEVAAEIAAAGGRVHAAPVDLADGPAVDAVIAAARDVLGPIDILVNNAGIASRGKAVADTDPDEPLRLLQSHAIGPHHLCRLVLPSMRERPRGDIVFISSVAAEHLAAKGAPYNMGKAAMEALALTLAKEELRNGIHVNIVAPGLVETEMGRRLVRAGGVEDISTLNAVMPFGRVCQPEDIGRVVAFLCSDAAGYVTGQRIAVDGGANR